MQVTLTSPDLPNPSRADSGAVGAVYTRSDGIFTPVVAWGEPGQSCWVGEEPFTFTTVPGQKYWIQVGGYSWWDYGHITTRVSY